MNADKFALVNRNALCESADIDLICCYNMSYKSCLGVESNRAAVCAGQHAVFCKGSHAVGNTFIGSVVYRFAVVAEETPGDIGL